MSTADPDLKFNLVVHCMRVLYFIFTHSIFDTINDGPMAT